MRTLYWHRPKQTQSARPSQGCHPGTAAILHSWTTQASQQEDHVSASTVVLFSRFGFGEATTDLEHKMASIFLSLLGVSSGLPGKLLFYTDGVKLVCEGSPVLEELQALQEQGVELVICSTCLNYFGLTDKVQVGTVGGMPAILRALDQAEKVISVWSRGRVHNLQIDITMDGRPNDGDTIILMSELLGG
jgi:sulfur relay (sulfurtransferase) complex TusBCD TusD component (DsrE family)